MKKLLSIVCLAGLCLAARGADIITATVTVTNVAGTTNGQTITVNSNVRTWTNNVVVPGSQILTNAAIGGAATNLFNQISGTPFTGLSLQHSGTNGILLQTAPGGALSVSLSVGWGTVVLSTNSTATTVGVRVPYTAEGAAQQTNITSGIVAMISSAPNTNSISDSSLAAANLAGLVKSQTFAGVANFSAAGGLNGNVGHLTNGGFLNPNLTNGINRGNAFSSLGNGTSSEQFGAGATATGNYTLAIGPGATASGLIATAIGNNATAAPASGDGALAVGLDAQATEDSTTAVGPESMASFVGSSAFGYLSEGLAVNATAIGKNSLVRNGHTNSTALGYNAQTSRKNQIALGNAEEVWIPGNLQLDGYATNLHTFGTNTFPAGSDISFGRYPITSLANGNNAGIVAGTNVFIEVSGPSAAFTINGIAGGRDGKFLIILNQTTFNMTIAHDSGTDPTAANRIYSMTGADRATTGNGAAMLIYSGAASRWILISFDP